MVKKINRLSARAVATLSKPGRHADGAGLYLRIDHAGAKRWVFLWERKSGVKRVQREAGLGSVLAVPLVNAFRCVEFVDGSFQFSLLEPARAADDAQGDDANEKNV